MPQQKSGPYGRKMALRLFRDLARKRVPVVVKKKGTQYFLTVMQPIRQVGTE